jgi:hypothetical protein
VAVQGRGKSRQCGVRSWPCGPSTPLRPVCDRATRGEGPVVGITSTDAGGRSCGRMAEKGRGGGRRGPRQRTRVALVRVPVTSAAARVDVHNCGEGDPTTGSAGEEDRGRRSRVCRRRRWREARRHPLGATEGNQCPSVGETDAR